MNQELLNKILQDHLLWLNNDGGKCASLSYANLKGANLSNACLSNANLSYANLIDTNLKNANLSNADLKNANLSNANLSNANLSYAYLIDTNLSNANLKNANLKNANLIDANLSNIKNLLNPTNWMNNNFKKNKLGFIVYKKIGNTTSYQIPSYWEIKENCYITEIVNMTKTQDCGCGVNFGTKDWCENNYVSADLWECLLEWVDLATLCVPYNTNGKARVGRLKLIKKIK